MKKKPTTFDISHRLNECLQCENVSNESKVDLAAYLELLKGFAGTASKTTHYHKLDEWSKPTFNYIHEMLSRYGFVSGGKARGIEQNPDASLWWAVYGMLSNITYSPSLKTQVASHHASAYERNAAMIIDVDYLVKNLK